MLDADLATLFGIPAPFVGTQLTGLRRQYDQRKSPWDKAILAQGVAANPGAELERMFMAPEKTASRRSGP